MTKTNTMKLDINRKLFLIIMGACLITMLVGSFAYRLSNPGLVMDGRPQVSSATQGPSDIDSVGTMMQRLQSQPNDVEALIFLGEHFLGHERWDQAGHFLERAVEAAPQEQRPLYLLGISQYHSTKYEAAAVSFERLLALADDPAARYNLGLLYLHYLNDRAQAEAHLLEVIEHTQSTDELRTLAKEALDISGESPNSPEGQTEGQAEVNPKNTNAGQ